MASFGQLESALDCIARPPVHGGEGGEGVDLFVGVDHLVVGGAKSVEVGPNPPVFQVTSLVLNDGVGSGWASDKLE